jgi:hypothetical protein
MIEDPLFRFDRRASLFRLNRHRPIAQARRVGESLIILVRSQSIDPTRIVVERGLPS